MHILIFPSLLRKNHIKKYLKILAEMQENNLAGGK